MKNKDRVYASSVSLSRHVRFACGDAEWAHSRYIDASPVARKDSLAAVPRPVFARNRSGSSGEAEEPRAAETSS